MFLFNDTATTEIYTLSLHDALPISDTADVTVNVQESTATPVILALDDDVATAAGTPVTVDVLENDTGDPTLEHVDRKSTRLNSSHANISYAVFCLKKKNTTKHTHQS